MKQSCRPLKDFTIAAVLAVVPFGPLVTDLRAQTVLTSPPNLFVPARGLVDYRIAMNPLITRSRPVWVNLDLLQRLVSGDSLRFDLFEDTAFLAVFERLEVRSPESYTWTGRLAGEESGRFTLAVEEGVVAGTIRVPGKATYSVRLLGAGVHVICEVDEKKLPPCAGGVIPRSEQAVQAEEEQEGEEALGHGGGGGGGNPSEMDVMVLYTPAVLASLPSIMTLEQRILLITATIQTAVGDTNQAFDNSALAAPELRLVLSGLISYSESGNANTELARLRNRDDDDDGDVDGADHMNDVHAIRDICGADLVCLLVKNLGDSCGIAYTWSSYPSGFSDWAFSVVDLDCISDLTFAHELGHNMGCHHDRDNACCNPPAGDPNACDCVADCCTGDANRLQAEGAFSYSYGHHFEGQPCFLNVCTPYRTIMAYEPGARLPVYSNPSVVVLGTATGVTVGQPGEAHNALTIDTTAPDVATFKPGAPTVVWVDFSHSLTEVGSYDLPYDTVEEGVAAVPTGGRLAFKGGARTGPLTFTKPMTMMAARTVTLSAQ